MKDVAARSCIIIVLGATMGLFACALGADDVKKVAAKDLACPESSIRVSKGVPADSAEESEDDVTYFAMGCDKHASYRISGKQIIKEK